MRIHGNVGFRDLQRRDSLAVAALRLKPDTNDTMGQRNGLMNLELTAITDEESRKPTIRVTVGYSAGRQGRRGFLFP